MSLNKTKSYKVMKVISKIHFSLFSPLEARNKKVYDRRARVFHYIYTYIQLMFLSILEET